MPHRLNYAGCQNKNKLAMLLKKEECGGSRVVCFGTVCGVFGVNSNHCLLPYGQLWDWEWFSIVRQRRPTVQVR